MTWKNGRRLATFTSGDVSASFDYDADGLRTTKTVGTSRVDYYRAGGLLLGEVHTDGSESYTINYMYDESGRMLGFRLDGAEYYYVRDYAGDVTGLINARGELIGSYLYDPWGVLLETYLNTFEEETAEWTDADRVEYMRVLNLNPIRYKSYYYDTETGFYYLQSRYYDPITTRFINADGLISTGTGVLGYNMFVYCNNNPIVYSDSTGMSMVLDNKGMLLGSYGGGYTGGGLLALLALLFTSLAKSNDTALPASPPIDKSDIDKKTSVAEDKDAVTVTDDVELAKKTKINMHHVVAKNARDAKPARDVLEHYKIDVFKDPDNLVPIHAEFHWGIHTNKYYAYVNQVITACSSEEEVRQALNRLKTEITMAEFTGVIPWA